MATTCTTTDKVMLVMSCCVGPVLGQCEIKRYASGKDNGSMQFQLSVPVLFHLTGHAVHQQADIQQEQALRGSIHTCLPLFTYMHTLFLDMADRTQPYHLRSLPESGHALIHHFRNLRYVLRTHLLLSTYSDATLESGCSGFCRCLSLQHCDSHLLLQVFDLAFLARPRKSSHGIPPTTGLTLTVADFHQQKAASQPQIEHVLNGRCK